MYSSCNWVDPIVFCDLCLCREVHKYWMERDVHLMAWTVNTKVEADKLVAMGIPVLTDDVAMAK